MKNTLETRLGLFVALIALAAIFIVQIIGGVEKFKSGHRIRALFNSAQELKVGARVTMAGVEIGKVEDIQLTNNKVQVTMKLRANAAVKTDSVATIKFTGLLGQNFVAVDFGSPEAPLATEDIILNSAEQPDLNAILAKLDNVATGVENLTKSFTGDEIANLFGPFTDFLKQNSEPLTATIANMKSVSTQIAEGQGTVGKLIYVDALYNSALNTVSNLQSTGDEIKFAIADARKIFSDVDAGKGTLGLLAKDEALYRETTASMTNLKEILQKINRGDGTVGKLVNDQEFYKNAKLTLQKVDKATESLEDQGPLSVIGIIAGGLF